jgi:hypothetical protein
LLLRRPQQLLIVLVLHAARHSRADTAHRTEIY